MHTISDIFRKIDESREKRKKDTPNRALVLSWIAVIMSVPLSRYSVLIPYVAGSIYFLCILKVVFSAFKRKCYLYGSLIAASAILTALPIAILLIPEADPI